MRTFWNKLNLRTWSYGGRELAHPLTILRRLIFVIPRKLFMYLFLLTIYLGWGKDEFLDAKADLY